MMLALLMSLSAMAAMIQVTLPLHWSPLDLCFLLTIFAGLRRGSGFGLLTGLSAGLVLDVLVSPVPGLRSVPLAMVGALADSLESGVNRDQARLQVLAVLIGLALHDALLMVLARRFDLSQGGIGTALGAYVLPRLIVQALLAVPAFTLLGLIVRQRVFQDPLQRPVRSIQRW